MRVAQRSACVIWRFSDGKPGHEAQTQGLINALAQRRQLQVHELSVHDYRRGLLDLVQKRFAPGTALPAPALLIGAGHATHWPLLAARRARGGRIIVLMKPSLPRSWFDLCIIPQHDSVPAGDKVFITQGPLNTLSTKTRTAGNTADASQGLFLIGGPSSHYAWSEPDMLQQIQQVVRATPSVNWLLTTSRRTPATFLAALQANPARNLELIPHSATAPGWVARQLAQVAQVWVSEDSMSMIFEALTAGAGVGLLQVPAKRLSRITRYSASLIDAAYVTAFAAWQPGSLLPAPAQPFNEAQRCARWLDEQWLGPHA